MCGRGEARGSDCGREPKESDPQGTVKPRRKETRLKRLIVSLTNMSLTIVVLTKTALTKDGAGYRGDCACVCFGPFAGGAGPERNHPSRTNPRAMDKLVAGFEAKTGIHVKVTYGSGLGTRKQVAGGRALDVSDALRTVSGRVGDGEYRP